MKRPEFLLPATFLGAILIGGAGSMGGAWLGESWKGSEKDDVKRIGTAAFWSRVFGTVAKSSLCTLMLVLSLASLAISGW